MISLRHFDKRDIPVLKEHYFKDKTTDEIDIIVNDMQKLEHDGKYFEMFAVCNNDIPVGSISLYQHSGYIISIGPIIYHKFRCKGYAYEGMKLAINLAKDKGYKIVSAQIKKDNTASINLHQKLGYLLDGEYINRKGNEVYIYLKLL